MKHASVTQIGSEMPNERQAAERDERIRRHAHRLPVRHDEAEAAHDFHRRERRDQRVDAQVGDHRAVHEADHRARRDRRDDRDERVAGGVEHHRAEHAGERDRRADRQVEVARGETEHHRARDHADLRDRQREAEHVLDREEVIDGQRHRDEHHDEDHDQAVFGDLLPPLLLVVFLRDQRVRDAIRSPADEVFSGFHDSLRISLDVPFSLFSLFRLLVRSSPTCGSARLSTDLFVRLAARQFARDPPLPHHDDPVRHAEHFRQFRRNHHDRAAAFGQLIDHVIDFVLRADVDAARRFVEDHDLQIRLGEPARQNRLLLIAARKKADFLAAARRLDLQQLDEAVGGFALPSCGRGKSPRAGNDGGTRY